MNREEYVKMRRRSDKYISVYSAEGICLIKSGKVTKEGKAVFARRKEQKDESTARVSRSTAKTWNGLTKGN